MVTVNHPGSMIHSLFRFIKHVNDFKIKFKKIKSNICCESLEKCFNGTAETIAELLFRSNNNRSVGLRREVYSRILSTVFIDYLFIYFFCIRERM